MNNKTRKEWREVLIQEYYEKTEEGVFRVWRIDELDDEWRRDLTPYKELPWVEYSPEYKVTPF